MRKSLMQQLAKYEGFCCAAHYIQAHSPLSTKEVAARLGVHRRAVNKWRIKILRPESFCSNPVIVDLQLGLLQEQRLVSSPSILPTALNLDVQS